MRKPRRVLWSAASLAWGSTPANDIPVLESGSGIHLRSIPQHCKHANQPFTIDNNTGHFTRQFTNNGQIAFAQLAIFIVSDSLMFQQNALCILAHAFQLLHGKHGNPCDGLRHLHFVVGPFPPHCQNPVHFDPPNVQLFPLMAVMEPICVTGKSIPKPLFLWGGSVF